MSSVLVCNVHLADRLAVGAGFYGVAGFLPGGQASLERIHVTWLGSVVDRLECRTGTRLFSWSRSVENECPVAREGIRLGAHLLLGQRQGPHGMFPVVPFRVPSVVEDCLPSVHQ